MPKPCDGVSGGRGLTIPLRVLYPLRCEFNIRMHAFSLFLHAMNLSHYPLRKGTILEVLPYLKLQIWSHAITLPCPEDRPSLYVAEILRTYSE